MMLINFNYLLTENTYNIVVLFLCNKFSFFFVLIEKNNKIIIIKLKNI
jgi:hypothetical protein